jgi:hypothetical protein
MALDATRVINGSYGSVFDANGNWLTNVTEFSANVEINKEEIMRSGSRWTGHKVTSLSGSGTISGYKVTTELIDAIGDVANDNGVSFVTEIQAKLADPEAYGAARIRLKGVQFDNIPLMNFSVGEVVTEELNFTFTGYELMEKITD